MTVTLLFFSSLRDTAGTGQATVELPPGSTGAALLAAVYTRHPGLRVHDASMLMARNQEWVSREVVLADGDEVALMPPVSGG